MKENNVIYKIYWILRYSPRLFIDYLCFLFPIQKKHAGVKKVLILRLDAIGDFILWLNSATEYRAIFPQNQFEITVMVNKICVPIAENLPYFDHVLPLDRKKFIRNVVYRLTTMKKVRQVGFNTVIQPTISREILLGDSIVRTCGANERIGSAGDYSNITPWQKRISDRWYTRLIPLEKIPLMELGRNAEFLRWLGQEHFKAGIPELPVSAFPTKNIGLPEYYVLFPGAGKTEKIWPKEYFLTLAERIYKATGWVGIVCGATGEERIGEFLATAGEIPLRNLVGRTSLDELVGVIAKASILIGNDTSGIHIAAAVSTPSVCILGGGHYGRFMPYRVEKKIAGNVPVPVFYKMDCFFCNWRCIYSLQKGNPAPCISHITVDSVWKTVEEILEKNK